jgi:SAM-dependent methyltransferase
LPSSDPRLCALEAWLAASAAGHSHPEACARAAAAAGPDPWQALEAATPLARARPALAEADLGLDLQGRPLAVDHRRACLRVPAGAPWPQPAPGQRKARGAFDTPRSMALRAVSQGLAAVEGAARRGLDPACGTGTFLLAMKQAGVAEPRGEDLDPAALAVARVVVPEARLELRDGLGEGRAADLVVGNPPFVPPERQDKALRRALRERLPWLHGRFDLAVPFAWYSAQRLRPGGGLCLVLPASLMVQPYGLELRRRWLARHRICWLGEPEPFPGARVSVVLLALRAGCGPAALPPWGVPPGELQSLPAVPFSTGLRPGDARLLAGLRQASLELGELFEVDTGVVVHGRGHRRADLVFDEPGPGRRPYADARDLRTGRRRWLDHQPARMHRPKRPELFEGPKLLVPRLVADRALEVYEDREGLWVGHTVNVLRPRAGAPPLDRVAAWLRGPAVRAILRLERGERLDVYPRDLRSLPLPRAWLTDPERPLAQAWGVNAQDWERLEEAGHS